MFDLNEFTNTDLKQLAGVYLNS